MQVESFGRALAFCKVHRSVSELFLDECLPLPNVYPSIGRNRSPIGRHLSAFAVWGEHCDVQWREVYCVARRVASLLKGI